jgi:hypothetical protein
MTLPESYWELKIWTDDLKTTLITTTPIHLEQRVSRDRKCNEPYTYEIDCFLSDQTANSIAMGYYFELKASLTSTKVLWCSGYIHRLSRTDDASNTFTLECVSAMDALNDIRTLGNFHTEPALGYTDIVKVHNGLPVSGDYPPNHKGILTGSGWSVEWTDADGTTSPPGAHDKIHADWDTQLASVLSLADHYNYYVREKVGVAHTAHSGVLQIGPLGDASGIDIWGGGPLLADMQSAHSFDPDAIAPDVGAALEEGYAVIQAAAQQEAFDQIYNLVWGIGHGKPEEGGVTLRAFNGGVPADNTGSAINGWTRWQPYTGGRVYYYKSQSRTTYAGHAYELIAAQQQDGADDATRGWAYGVIDRTSAGLYGVHEYTLLDEKFHHPDHLLSACLAFIEFHSDPVSSWQFVVKHPLISANGVPDAPEPGQLITVHYSGAVHDALTIDNNPANDTFGHPIGAGAYTYMTFPGTADSAKIRKLRRVIEMQDEWSGGQYTQTLTLGQGHWKWSHWADGMAKRMERNLHRKRSPGNWKKQLFHNVHFFFSESPYAYEDETANAIFLNPGAFVVSDVPNTNFFDEGHAVSFTVTVTDGNETLDFWFAKKIDATVTGLSSSVAYGLLRLAFGGSGNSCGFKSTTDGTTFTSRGRVPSGAVHAGVLSTSKRLSIGTYRVSVRWHNGHYNAWIWAQDPHEPAGIAQEHWLATWSDKNPKILGTWGAIGFHLTGGSDKASISALHAQPHHTHKPHKRSVGYAATMPGQTGGSHRTVTTAHGGLVGPGKSRPI